jgi:hypothetical protein
MSAEHGAYGVVQVDSRIAHRKRLRQMLRHLLASELPEVRLVAALSAALSRRWRAQRHKSWRAADRPA